MKSKEVEEIYNKKSSSYLSFINFFRYRQGIKSALVDSSLFEQRVGVFFFNCGCLLHETKILDAGCGSGIMTRNLYEIGKKKKLNGLKFHAFDLTQKMLDLFEDWIKKEKAKNIELKRADVLDLSRLPKAWKDYDLVVSSAMLEYLPKNKIRKALKNLRRLMKDGGTIFVFITRKNFLMKLLIKKWWKANAYSKQEMKKIFRDSGFREIKFRKFSAPYNHLNVWGFIVEARRQGNI